ncbi:MAG: flagellar biosynthesis protein FlgA [Geminicoccaceae bacterium]|nr:flagellar biosynthesis protein FlgA [Geminicoccaceae bacterium]
MRLTNGLRQRAMDGNPIGVGLIGCGKFATMFLAQAARTPGIAIRAIADLDPAGARAKVERSTGLDADEIHFVDNHASVVHDDDVELVIEATGDPVQGVVHALAAIEARRHILMVNVEADVLVGPALAKRARHRGVVYSLAYGDQPALVVELVDWAHAAGFEIVAAGKGTKHRPHFRFSTPETVWDHYGLTPERAAASGMNPKMFNSFLDGTKSAIEMAAIANATDLEVAPDGLLFPPAATGDLATVLSQRAASAGMNGHGMVETVSCLDGEGRPVPNDLRWGVYVVFKAASDYVAGCFRDYGLVTDPSGRYATLWRPCHLIGLELGISVADMALRGEPTGAPWRWAGDVAATAKRDLEVGETLDGEGGFTVYGALVPAAVAAAEGLLPIGLAHHARLRRKVARDRRLTLDDVELDRDTLAWELRTEILKESAPP